MYYALDLNITHLFLHPYAAVGKIHEVISAIPKELVTAAPQRSGSFSGSEQSLSAGKC